jgi:hypothetical protein
MVSARDVSHEDAKIETEPNAVSFPDPMTGYSAAYIRA